MRREFTTKVKREIWERAKGACEKCGASIIHRKFEFHHLYGAHSGMARAADGELWCMICHREETAKVTIPLEAKIKRVRDRHRGIRSRSRFRGWRKFNGERVWNDR